MRRVFLLVFLLGAVVACGGGGGAGSPATQAPRVPGSTMTNESLSIFVPSQRTSTSHSKRPQFIVAGTQSVRIRIYTVNGATPSPQPADTIAQIGPTAPGCSTINGGTSCTINVSVPITNQLVLEILSYASTDGSGTPLAEGFLGPIDTTSPTITPVPVALGGYVSSLALSPATIATTVPSSSIQHYTFTVTAKDANGNIILPPGSYSPSIFFSASNDPNSAISFSPNPLTEPASNGTNTVTLSFDPTKTFSGSTTITATANTVTAKLTFSPSGSTGGGIVAGARIF